jgi:NAD-dependent DNA ligase
MKAPASVIRGELVVPRTAVSVLARSWVNGIIHRKDPDPVDVSKIRFVAYDLLSPEMGRSQAFKWLKAAGFELPWFAAEAAGASATTEESLKATLIHRRKDSPYDTDGIVVAVDGIPQRPEGAKNPKDAVAFKMPLADQSAETTVRAVLWAPSAQGYLIPKVEFDPVTIGSATIQFASAHNAKLVESSGLGPGARIVIRRSGDVIPTIDKVLVGAASGAQMPLKGTYEWASDVHIKQIGESKEQVAAKLQHFLKTLEIPGAGPATAVALVEGGIPSPKKLLLASPELLGSLLGPTTGPRLYKAVRMALAAASELQLMIASSSLPRGVGESKLKILFDAEPDPKRWTLESRPGWTEASLAAFLEQLPVYFKWREEELGASYNGPKMPVNPAIVTANPEKREIFCMTGFRDKAIEASLIAAGHSVSATLTGKVTVLLVPDGERKESEKVKAAAAKGIPILSASVAKAKYLS